jgi:hypothetical protein
MDINTNAEHIRPKDLLTPEELAALVASPRRLCGTGFGPSRADPDQDRIQDVLSRSGRARLD